MAEGDHINQAIDDDKNAYQIFSKAKIESEFKVRFARFVENFCDTSAHIERLELRMLATDHEIKMMKNEGSSDDRDTLTEIHSSKRGGYVTRASTEFLAQCSEINLLQTELETIISLCSLEDVDDIDLDSTNRQNRNGISKSSSIEIGDMPERKSIVQLLKTLKKANRSSAVDE